MDIEVYGFETDKKKALNIATARINQQFSTVAVHFELDNFLGFVLEHFGDSGNGSLFRPSVPKAYNLIIANPPYVRTQIMGASTAQLLAEQFGLTGRVDLYYAFILGMAWVLKPQGVAEASPRNVEHCALARGGSAPPFDPPEARAPTEFAGGGLAPRTPLPVR